MPLPRGMSQDGNRQPPIAERLKRRHGCALQCRPRHGMCASVWKIFHPTLNGRGNVLGKSDWKSLYMNRNCNEPADDVKWRLLQGAEGIRAWKSLDEIRHCVLCERTFSGREVRLLWDAEGMPHLACPSNGCSSAPAEWIHPGNPLVSADAWRDWVRLLDTLCEEPARVVPKPVPKKRNGIRFAASSKRSVVALRN